MPSPSKRLVVYIDGESHFIRSENAWRGLHLACTTLDDLSCKSGSITLVDRRCKLFWSRFFSPGAHRLVYFSAFSGDEVDFHEACKSIRNFGLEPNIYHEPSDLRKRRQKLLDDGHVIEKAKQVDIGLTVRALHDAHLDVFDECHLYTSDIDFIPLIKAIMARGPTVKVFGFSNGLGSRSDLLTVPDQFVDLTKSLAEQFEVRKV